jgi:baculoviral IAP repeat-containing protein 6 (apollon)
MSLLLKNNLYTHFSLPLNIINTTIDTLIIIIDKYTISLKLKDNNTWIINIQNYYLDWLNQLNILSIKKKLTLEELIEQICYNVKLEHEQNSRSRILDIFNQLYIENKINNIRETLLRYYLETNIKENTIKSNKERIFDEKTLAKILIEEYINLYKLNYNIDLINKNIYHWNIKFNNFTNKDLNLQLSKLQDQYNYSYIEVELEINRDLYPNYPPSIKIIRPKLKNNLMQKIINTKMIQLDYWTPSRNLTYIITKLQSLFENHAIIDLDCSYNNPNLYKSAYSDLELSLAQFNTCIDSLSMEDIDTVEYKKNKFDEAKSVKISNIYFAKGTGYGYDGQISWDINAYNKSLEEKDKNKIIILNNILKNIINTTDDKLIVSSLHNSSFLEYIKTELASSSFIEMSKHNNLYAIIFKIINEFISRKFIPLLIGDDKKSICESITNLYNFVKLTAKLSVEYYDDNMKTICDFYEKINQLTTNISKHVSKHVSIHVSIQELKEEKNYINSDYINYMNKNKFDFSQILTTNYYYKNDHVKDKGLKVSYHKRLVQEYTTLQNILPVDYNAIITMRVDENDMSVHRVLMTGPKDTPYENGCFIFDTYIPPQYPNMPPQTWFINHGGKRMNPNLYDNGKVCLSLLGTWPSGESEKWNPSTSTLFQLYMSIQSQILVEEPYYNEPGYEKKIGCKDGFILSRDYNVNIRYYTMCHAIRDLLKLPDVYSQFKEIILQHFKLKKKEVIETCSNWTDDAPEYMKYKYKTVLNEITELYKKID